MKKRFNIFKIVLILLLSSPYIAISDTDTNLREIFITEDGIVTKNTSKNSNSYHVSISKWTLNNDNNENITRSHEKSSKSGLLLDSNKNDNLYTHSQSNQGTLNRQQIHSQYENNSSIGYNSNKSVNSNFSIKSSSNKYISSFQKNTNKQTNIFGLPGKKTEYENEFQIGREKPDFRKENFYYDENGKFKNGYGIEADNNEKSKYDVKNHSIKNKAANKIKEWHNDGKIKTSIKFAGSSDEKPLFEIKDSLFETESKHKNPDGSETTEQTQILGYNFKGDWGIDANEKGAGASFGFNNEIVLARHKKISKFTTKTPYVPIEFQTTDTSEALTEANANADVRIGRDGVNTKLSFDAYAGARKKYEIGTATKIFGIVLKVGGEGSVGYGAGVEGKFDANVSWSKIKLNSKLGATLGLGGALAGNIEIDVSGVPKHIEKYTWGNTLTAFELLNQMHNVCFNQNNIIVEKAKNGASYEEISRLIIDYQKQRKNLRNNVDTLLDEFAYWKFWRTFPMKSEFIRDLKSFRKLHVSEDIDPLIVHNQWELYHQYYQAVDKTTISKNSKNNDNINNLIKNNKNVSCKNNSTSGVILPDINKIERNAPGVTIGQLQDNGKNSSGINLPKKHKAEMVDLPPFHQSEMHYPTKKINLPKFHKPEGKLPW